MNLEIIEQLSETEFKVKLTPAKKHNGKVEDIHDYIRFSGFEYLSSKFPITINGNTSYNLHIDTSVSFPIRIFYSFVLPYLQKSEYLQPEHFVDKKDSKGESYVNYSFYDQVVKFWEDGEEKVAVLLKGEKTPNIVTLAFYEKFIEPNFKY